MTNQLAHLIVVGDRVLIKPKTTSDKTRSGLYLPQGIREKEDIQSGYIMKTGPGYAIPSEEADEIWKSAEDRVKYIPLQAQEGDLAIFLVNQAYEVMYAGEKYFIAPQHAILMLERDEDLLK